MYIRENDLAIIKLYDSNRIKFKIYSDHGLFESTESSDSELSGSFVRPICLPRKNTNNDFRKHTLWVAGFGKTNRERTNTKIQHSYGLKHGQMKYMRNGQCEKKFSDAGIPGKIISSTQVCAFSNSGDGKYVDTCPGDSAQCLKTIKKVPGALIKLLHNFEM